MVARYFLFVLLLLPFVTFCDVITADGSVDYTIGTTGQSCSLRGAIINANADSIIDTNCPTGNGTDTILLTTSFTLSVTGRGENIGHQGDLDVTSNIIIIGSSPDITISANNIDRIFDVFGGHLVGIKLENLTLTNGYDNGFPGDVNMGGAIRTTTEPYVILDNVKVLSNTVDLSSKFEAIQASAGVLAAGIFRASNVEFRNNRVIGNIPSGSVISGAVSLYADTDTIIDGFVLDSNSINDTSVSNNIVSTGGFGLFGPNRLLANGYAINNRGKNGGVAFAGSLSQEMVIRLTGDMESNTADLGGCFDHRSSFPLIVELDGHSFLNNYARIGGVFYGQNLNDTHVIFHDFDKIQGNSALRGGVGAGINVDFYISFGNNITGNTATTSGGLISGENIGVIVDSVDYITNNVAQTAGGLIFADNVDYDTLKNVTIMNVKSLHNNRAEQFDSTGGVVSVTSASVHFDNIETITNQFAYQGGVISAIANTHDTHFVTFKKTSLIAHNRVDHPDVAGGVIYTVATDVDFSEVNGPMYNNSAHNGDGAIIGVESANILIHDCIGDIYDNFAFSGSIFAVLGSGFSGIMTDIRGNIYDNTGFFNGGILACSGINPYCELSNFVGNITGTECGSGCVIHSSGAAVMQNIIGDMTDNHAHFEGGLIFGSTITVNNIDGSLSNNFAEQESGGLFYSNSAPGTISVSSVREMDSNFAKTHGGIAFSGTGSVTIDRCCIISNNIAEDGNGGVAFGEGSVAITFSTLLNNSPNNVFSNSSTATVDTSFSDLSGSASLISFNGENYVAQASPANGSGGYTYLWDNGDTTQISENINTSITSVIITDDSYCRVSDTVEIPDPVADAGISQLVCPDATIVLGGSPAGSAGTQSVPGVVSYLWTPTENIINDNQISNPTAIIYNENTEFTLQVTDIGTGVSTTDTVTLTAYPVTADAGSDAIICSGQTVTIGGSPTGTAEGLNNIIYSWTPNQFLNNPLAANPIASPVRTTTYNVTVSSNECRTVSAMDSVTITVFDFVDVVAVANPSDANNYFLCKGDSITLGGDSTTGSGITYSWSPSTGLNNPNVANPVASPSVTTVYTLSVFGPGQCTVDTDTVTVTVSDLTANAGGDIVNAGTLGGIPTASGGTSPYLYIWSPSTGLGSNQLSNPFAQPSRSTTYTVSVTDFVGCTVVSDDVNVIVRSVSTSGYLTIRFSYSSATFPSTSAVQANLENILTSVLDIPPLALSIETIVNEGDAYLANIIFYQFGGEDGDAIADNFVIAFGCVPDSLPCFSSPYSSIMIQVGWDYLEIVAPTNSGNPENSSDYGLSTLTVSLSTETTFIDDDIDLNSSLFNSLILDDDEDVRLSQLISGNDDDDATTDDVIIGTVSIATTRLTSLYVAVEDSGSNLTISLLSMILVIIVGLM